MTAGRVIRVVGAVVVGAAVAGCNLDEDTRYRLDALDELSQIRSGFADTGREGYWLGPRYRGLRLSRAELNLRTDDLLLSYGRRACQPGSGCTWPLNVFTSLRRDLIRDPPICWRRHGPAWVLGCSGYAELELLTGRDVVYVESLAFDVRPTIARLRSIHGRRALRPPRPFSCREQRRFPVRVVRRLPAVLAAGCAR